MPEHTGWDGGGDVIGCPVGMLSRQSGDDRPVAWCHAAANEDDLSVGAHRIAHRQPKVLPLSAQLLAEDSRPAPWLVFPDTPVSVGEVWTVAISCTGWGSSSDVP